MQNFYVFCFVQELLCILFFFVKTLMYSFFFVKEFDEYIQRKEPRPILFMGFLLRAMRKLDEYLFLYAHFTMQACADVHKHNPQEFIL